MLLNIDSFLASFFQLIEHALRPLKLLGLAFDFQPAFASGHLDAERILQRLQQLEVVSKEGLQRPRALKLQGAGLGHNREPAKNTNTGERLSLTSVMSSQVETSLIARERSEEL